MWDDGDGEMGCKDGDRLGRYQHGKNANLRAYRCSGTMGMADKINSEYSGGQGRWQRCGTTGMDTTVEDMRDGKRRDLGRWRYINGLEERQRTGIISTWNDYQPEGVSSL